MENVWERMKIPITARRLTQPRSIAMSPFRQDADGHASLRGGWLGSRGSKPEPIQPSPAIIIFKLFFINYVNKKSI
jgi:hypothetical protein